MKKKPKILERDIEKYLVSQVKKIGGKAYKWSSPGNRAVPDRICFFPNGTIAFVELKAPFKRPTPLQRKVIRLIQSFGQEVLVIDSKNLVDIFCETIVELRKEVENDK